MLSFSSILSDARNFMSNNIAIIFIMVLVLSIVNQIISAILYPNIESISQIQSLLQQTIETYGGLTADGLSKTLLALSEQQQQQLVSAAMNYLMQASMIFFINNIILMSGILSLIYVISHQQFSLNNVLQRAIQFAPQIALFMLLIIPGFIILSIFASILMPLAAPLAILAIIFYLSMYVIFLSVIIEPTLQINFIQKLKITFRFLKREIRLIVPIIAIWFFTTFLLKNIVDMLMADNFIISIVINVIKSLLIFITICYLYRLFSLSNKELPYDSRH
ncbi:YciC family protein [Orbus mooreae]|uniref:YciC family protein n=1 Tax=Orbus mooreae TaxID=3074107 RepID=UPI00370CFDD0